LLFQLPSIAELIARVIVILIAMDVHEFAHAYVAYRMGDTTARDAGRMTLNPFVNINWFGFLMWVAIGFGILGSAPVNEYRMRDRRWGMLAAVAAGPISNLLLAAVAAIPFWLGMRPDLPAGIQAGRAALIPTIPQILTIMVYFNVLLFLFNLIPLFPLDGWTVLLKLLPPDMSYRLAPYAQFSSYLFFGLIFLSFARIDVLGAIIGPPFNFLLRFFLFRSL